VSRGRQGHESALGLRGFPVRPNDRRPSVAGRALLGVTLVLVVFGLVSVYSASAYLAQTEGLPDTHYFFGQMSRAGIGLLALAVGAAVDYRVWRRLAWPIVGVVLLLLLLVVVPGTAGIAPRVNGARRWLDLGVTVQPSELAKIAVVIWTAALAVKKQERLESFRYGLLPILIVVGTVCGLVVLEPHFSAALWIAVLAGVVLFAGGARLRHFAALGAALVPVAAAQVVFADYRLRRLLAFLDPGTAGGAGSYQLRQSLIAVGNGGLFGVGFGRSTAKMAFLPEPQNDFIFSVIAEEWGFIGAAFVVGLFVAWALLGLRIARTAPDLFGRLLAVGITFLVALAAFAHMGVALGLLPTTGVNLPFISAGGTNLVLMLGATGILLNVSAGRDR
jgi:cell division protein FtsW